MSYWNKEKKSGTFSLPKKKSNWNQSLLSIRIQKPEKKLKKSFQYLFLLKKYEKKIDYKNVKLLQAFLTKYGKIRSRRKTRIPRNEQRLISKAIRKARAFKLIPFTCSVETK